MATPSSFPAEIGLRYWMKQVVVRADEAANDFNSRAVHGLRTALRRCRSMAEGLRMLDGEPGWKKMRRAGKELFSSLGTLRDTHVMMEWVENLSAAGDPTREKLMDLLREQEQRQKISAGMALEDFDRKQWQKWAEELPDRALRVPLDSPIFRHLALEKWEQAHALHVQALRNRSSRAFHELRIGIKRLRYTVENFLPTLNASWGDDLKNLQDVLGEVHDLDVVWQAASSGKVFSDASARALWRSRLTAEKSQRVNQYREKMVGPASLWAQWRTELPMGEATRMLALERLNVWASFMDPEFAHARHAADLSKQLYDRVFEDELVKSSSRKSYGEILLSAALMHDVGRSRSSRGHHKASARLIRKLPAPLGIRVSEINLMALVARYHRGALPQAAQRRYAALPESKQKLVLFLAGILRLACACDRDHDGRIKRLDLDSSGPAWIIRAEGYDEASPFAEHLAAARHLLELACRKPILIVPAKHIAEVAA